MTHIDYHRSTPDYPNHFLTPVSGNIQQGSPHDDVLVELYWYNQTYYCVIPGVDSFDFKYLNEDFACHPNSDSLLNGSKIEDNEQYGMKLQYENTIRVLSASLFIIDVFGNRYNIGSYCGAKQFWYWISFRTYRHFMTFIHRDHLFNIKGCLIELSISRFI